MVRHLGLALTFLISLNSAHADATVLDRCSVSGSYSQSLTERISWAASAIPTQTRSQKQLEQAKEIERKLVSLEVGSELPRSVLLGFLNTTYQQLSENINTASAYFIELRKRDSEDVARSLNIKVEWLNQLLTEAASPAEKGVLFDSPRIEEQAQSAFKLYQKAYYLFSSDGAGPLIWTTALQQKIGSIRKVERDLKKADKSSVVLREWYTFEPHRRVESKDVSLAIENALFVLEKASTKLRKTQFDWSFRSSEDLVSEIKDLIARYPAAVGQLIARNPEYSLLVCRAVSGINQDRAEEVSRDGLYENTMMLATAASIATGGTGLGLRALGTGFKELAGGLWKFAAQSATFGSLWMGAHESERFITYMGKGKELRAGFLSKNGDLSTLIEADQAFEELDRAYEGLMWTVGGTLVALPSIKKFALIEKYGSIRGAKLAAKIEQKNFLASLTDLIKRVADSPTLKTRFTLARQELGEGLVDKFFVKLTDLPKAKQLEALRRLEALSTEAVFIRELEMMMDELFATKNITSNIRYAKEINIEQFRRVLDDIFKNDLNDVVKNLAKEFKVTRLEMIRRLAQAKTTVSEVLEEVKAHKGFFAKLKDGAVTVLNNPAMLTEVARNPRLLLGTLLWQYRNRVIADPELKNMIMVFVTLSAVTTMVGEKKSRGENFWDQWDMFTTDLVTFAITEIVLVSLGTKTVTGAKALQAFARGRKTSLPENIFDRGYALGDRLLRYGKDGLQVVTASAVTTYTGYQFTQNFLASDESQFMSSESNIDQSVYLIAMESFLFGSSTFRYHLLNKGRELFEKALKSGKFSELRNLVYTTVSLGNDMSGSFQFVWWQNFLNQYANSPEAQQ